MESNILPIRGISLLTLTKIKTMMTNIKLLSPVWISMLKTFLPNLLEWLKRLWKKWRSCDTTTTTHDRKASRLAEGVKKGIALTARAMQLIAERYEVRYNVLDRVPEIRRKESDSDSTQPAPTEKFSPLTDVVRNTMVIELHKANCSVWNSDVMRIVASEFSQPFHPFVHFLDHLPQWDGTDRVIPLALRVSDDELWTRVFHTWMRTMVAVWMHGSNALLGREDKSAVGCSGNSMTPLLLSEEQGLRKSTFCRLLLPPELRIYFTDKFDLSGSTSPQLVLARYGLINLDEFDSMSLQQTAKLKNLVQLEGMTGRKPYSGQFTKLYRLASFIGTSNRLDLLTDPSGSRRFFCQEVTKAIDCDAPIDYAQLYAQLLHEVKTGEPTYFSRVEEDEIQAHNLSFYHTSTLREVFLQQFSAASEGASSAEGTWLTATAILQRMRHGAGSGMLQGASPSTLGRELTQMNVPHKRCSRGTLYRVVEKKI